MGIINFAKINEKAIIPNKREEDLGYDIYACFDEDYVEIPMGKVVLIPTGIASSFPNKYGILLRERGSTGTKGMSVRAGVIDSGFRNQWLVVINNTSDKNIIIAKNPEDFDTKEYTVYPYTKAIAQAILVDSYCLPIEEIPYEELQKIPSERGLGMLGSSNK